MERDQQQEHLVETSLFCEDGEDVLRRRKQMLRVEENGDKCRYRLGGGGRHASHPEE